MTANQNVTTGSADASIDDAATGSSHRREALTVSTYPSRRQRRRRAKLKRRAITSTVLAAVLAASGLIVADAHKTVTLDLHGETRTVTTFAGSIAGLLEREGIELDQHDIVVPATMAPLTDGAEVVIRYGTEVEFEVDGEPTTGWVAALDAADALDTLGRRGRDVRLVASRSSGRAEIPLSMLAPGGEIAVVSDGRTRTVEYSGLDVEGTLAQAGVFLTDDDTVTLVAGKDADLPDGVTAPAAIVVQRIITSTERQKHPIPYDVEETTDPNRYRDLGPVRVQAGVEGENTRIYQVTRVDGVEVEREFLSESVTIEPISQITARGTRERPPPPPPPPAPAPFTPAPYGANGIPEHVWVALAQCESGGRPDAVSPGGRFHGLYQFSIPTWQSVGGTGLPSQASPAEQRARAVALQARSGWGQWPACSRRIGVR